MNTLGARLRYARERKGLTQAALAAQAGTSQQSVNMAECGRAKRPRSLHEMAGILGVSVDWLLTGREGGGMAHMGTVQALTVSEGGAAALQADALPTRQALPVFRLPSTRHPGMYQRSESVIDFVPRPPSLDAIQGAYAVPVQDRVMAPRYVPGDVLMVHSGKPIVEGDACVFTLLPQYAQEGNCIIARVQMIDDRCIQVTLPGLENAKPFDLYRSRLSDTGKIIGLYHK